MHLSCDVTLRTSDGKSFEWALFLRADTYAEAVALAEKAIAQRWAHEATIAEIFISPDSNSWEKQAAGADQSPGLYASREPVEIGTGQGVFQRLVSWLFGYRK